MEGWVTLGQNGPFLTHWGEKTLGRNFGRFLTQRVYLAKLSAYYYKWALGNLPDLEAHKLTDAIEGGVLLEINPKSCLNLELPWSLGRLHFI